MTSIYSGLVSSFCVFETVFIQIIISTEYLLTHLYKQALLIIICALLPPVLSIDKNICFADTPSNRRPSLLFCSTKDGELIFNSSQQEAFLWLLLAVYVQFGQVENLVT